LLFDSALPHLAGAKVVYLFPHGDLHRLPLHALTVKGEPLIQRVPVAYAPSLAILGRTLTRHREPVSHSSGSALVLAFADANDPESRKEFGEEAGRIAFRLGSTPIVDLAANGAAIRSQGPTAAIIHLACHGFFSTDDPLGSGIVLADGVFAARDWMAVGLQCDLVTLSACESGRLQTSRGDEVTGVTRALLYAGASTAIVTLWRVWSDAALRWTLEFYSRAWGEDGMKRCDDATAFREATLALRAEDPDVVAWAPFVLVGDWQ
jgi:CHAT domain-containing protein